MVRVLTSPGHTLAKRAGQKLALLLALLVHTLSAHAAPQVLLPKYRLFAHELAVIVNDNDPLSQRIAAYYQKTRNIPPQNILHVRFRPDRAGINESEFTRIYRQVQNATPPGIQAYALTWAAPWRVACMSITSAFTFGFDRAYCSARQCARTRTSAYFRSASTAPYNDSGIRPTMAIAAADFSQARALIDRGITSDNTLPPGTAWLVSTRDRARNVRAAYYPTIEKAMRGWLDTRIVETNALRNIDDILFYFTGLTTVKALDTLRFRPGAIADHLTSAGGQLTTSKQMSALRWLEAGATGSYGTVVEPCNLPGKFPHPGLVMDAYGSGRTLIEAYWQSVQQPGEGIFIGEPLAAPFDGQKVEVHEDYILLTTRNLVPGLYQVAVSNRPVGPFRVLPGLLKVDYHQQKFRLPKLSVDYYRLERLQPER